MAREKVTPPDPEVIDDHLGPEFLESLRAYFDRYKGRRFKQVRRDVALFATHLIETRSRHSLCEAYGGKAICDDADLGAELRREISEAVGKHRAAGFGHRSVIKYTSAVRGAVRHLSRLEGRPDPGTYRVQHSEPVQGRGNRRNKDAASVPYLSMDQVGSLFSQQFASDLARVCTSNRGSASIRALLTTLTMDNSSTSRRLVSILSEGEGRTEGSVALVVTALESCEARLMSDFGLTRSTVQDRLKGARIALERLGGLEGRNYPAFRKSNFTIAHEGTAPQTESLVDLPLPIDSNLKGASRQRAALAIIREAASRELDACVRVFERMQRIMRGDFDDLGGVQALLFVQGLRTVLIAEDHSFKTRGYGQFHILGERTNTKEVDEAVSMLSRRDAWATLGLEDAAAREKRIDKNAVRRMVLMGLGATRRAVHACMIIFCCEHGWNLQPMWDIPQIPFFFEVDSSAAVGSLGYIAAFKNKAGHDVLAMLERYGTRPEIVRGRAMHAWETTSREGSWGEDDHYSLVEIGGAAYRALELIAPLAASARAYASIQELRDRFFVHLSDRAGVVGFQESLTIVATFSSAPLNTRGLTFPVIRKSFQQLRLREVGSVEGLRPVAGHTKTNILQRHYVNSEDIVREVLESVRFFQNSLQALIVSETGISGNLAMNEKTLEWFYNLAQFSGIAGAIGLGASTSAGPRKGIYNFVPTDANLRSLIAAHLSLKRAKRNTEPYRFAVYGVPLLGFIIAIEAKLRRSGLTALFRATARQMLSDCKANRIALPRIL